MWFVDGMRGLDTRGFNGSVSGIRVESHVRGWKVVWRLKITSCKVARVLYIACLVNCSALSSH